MYRILCFGFHIVSWGKVSRWTGRPPESARPPGCREVSVPSESATRCFEPEDFLNT